MTLDLVYTWVDGSDPAWRARRDRALESFPPGRYRGEAVSDARFVENDEIKYSLRSAQIYAPFVRNVYVVTDGQVPRWLDTAKKGIRVVDHGEIVPAEDRRPMFNSSQIETYLHRIPGLSENFLYANDDCFFGGPCGPSDFLFADNAWKVRMSLAKIREELTSDEITYHMWRNSMRAVSAKLGPFYKGSLKHHGRNFIKKWLAAVPRRGIWNKPAHAIQVFNRGLIEEAFRFFREEIALARRHPFRHAEATDGLLLSHYYALWRKKARVQTDDDCGYYFKGDSKSDLLALQKRLTDPRGSRLKLFCVNDGVLSVDFDFYAETRRMLNGLFPAPGRFERPE